MRTAGVMYLIRLKQLLLGNRWKCVLNNILKSQCEVAVQSHSMTNSETMNPNSHTHSHPGGIYPSTYCTGLILGGEKKLTQTQRGHAQKLCRDTNPSSGSIWGLCGCEISTLPTATSSHLQ